MMNPSHPVYIISKGRWDSRHTSKALEKMNMPYSISKQLNDLIIKSMKIIRKYHNGFSSKIDRNSDAEFS